MNWTDGSLKKQFSAARGKGWTAGYASLNEDRIGCGSVQLQGEIPDALRGVLYRNGPARHERGDARYSHRWDGDGMIQAFRLSESGVTHAGRMVATKKYRAETAAGQFLVSAFGSSIKEQSLFTSDIDDMNVANINVCVHGGELLALWEAGSAYRMDMHSLETRGIKVWGEGRSLLPFSAHPKKTLDGLLWNFGADPVAGVLSIFALASSGAVVVDRQIRIDQLPPIHDFAVTAKHLVFAMSPLVFSTEKLKCGASFAMACDWTPALGTRVLVVSKNDWSMRWYTLPAMSIYHIGNAWEDGSGWIRFDMMAAVDPRFALKGWTLMRGEYRHVRGPVMTTVELAPDMTARYTFHKELEAEFPVVDAAFVGTRYDKVLCLSRSSTQSIEMPGWDRVSLFNVEGGGIESFCYGDNWMAEEHVFAQSSGGEGKPAEWIVGTALDCRKNQTVLSVFSANGLRDGPVAQARLPYALPVGLHGTYHASA